MEASSVSRAAANYLHHYHETAAAQEHVDEVIGRFQRLVNLATERAISELNFPFNVNEMAPIHRTIA